MDELDESEKDRQLVEHMAQDPLGYLRGHRQRGKSCLDCIVFLQKLRKEIQGDAAYVIHNPHPIYAVFHRFSNGTVEHHIALFCLLKDAGFTRIEVSAGILDFLPDRKLGETRKSASRGDTVGTYLRLRAKALDAVFGQQMSD